jgi:hypothetical protein
MLAVLRLHQFLEVIKGQDTLHRVAKHGDISEGAAELLVNAKFEVPDYRTHILTGEDTFDPRDVPRVWAPDVARRIIKDPRIEIAILLNL